MHQNWKHTYFVSLFWISNSNCLQIAKPHQPKWTPKLNKMDINSWKGKMFCLWDFLGFDFYAIEFILKKEKKKKAIMTEIAKAVLCQELSPSVRNVWAARHLRDCHGITDSHTRSQKLLLNWTLEVSVQPVPRALFIAIFPGTDGPGWCLPTPSLILPNRR